MPTPAELIIRPPGWFRVMYASLTVACALLTFVFLLWVRGSLGVRIGVGTLAFTLLYAMITASAFARRFELKQDRLKLVVISGSRECAVEDIAALRLTRIGDGQSRCLVVRRDGSNAFGSAQTAWRTADLVRLAGAIGVPIQGLS